MKKQFLFVAALMSASLASAQVEVGQTVQLEAGAATAGTLLAESESVTMTLAFDDEIKNTSCEMNSFTSATVGDLTLNLKQGVTGSTNPSGMSVTSTPTGGFVLKFNVKKDGYLYVLGKLSSNKNYWAFETEEHAIGYKFYMNCPELGVGPVASYEIKTSATSGDYAEYNWLEEGQEPAWPEKIILGADAADVKKNGVGVIVVPVFAEAETYYVHAQGSKVSAAGFFFSPEEINTLTLSGTNADTGEELSLALIGGNGTGITNITAAETADAPAYNIAGQRVNADAKGLIIKNGKKFVNK